ncbi:MAG: hypothetical protein AVDCRST_MAG02-3338 [uncultured Rubrobacteraceae bacterium]|uniref:Uncharacterized protein n=1 Tax=uncultured Rubrobacteraceae bacterium TaxID=349277 RepID=A0A6J4RD86_9ACTN|nr:MAG: hypothetical protein AVDCRST_MAG02-3338 [uncultured Rubrobacteraceae bacterium]
MSTNRKSYVGAAGLLLCVWLAIAFLAPEGSLWGALRFPVALAFGLVSLPALFGPTDDPLKKWHRG